MMELTWFGTAAFRLVVNETVLWFDPYLSRGPRAKPAISLRPRDVSKVDLILLSHGHFDHAADAIHIAKQTGARLVASSPVCDRMHDMGVPAWQLRPVQGVATLNFEAFRVRTIPGEHVRFDRALLLRTLRRGRLKLLPILMQVVRFPIGQVLGYLVSTPDWSLCFLGSAGFRREQLESLSPDIALVPVQGRSDICHLAAQLVEYLQPRWVIPHHFDDFAPPLSEMVDLEPFLDEVARRCPAVHVHVPEVGQAITYARNELQPL